VMERLRAAGYLNDTTFAEQWIAGRGAARGRRALAEELRQKGVDRATVDEALAAVRGEETEAESARNAAVRRVGERPADTSREARLRLAAFLQRRGFSWDVVRPVLTELFGIREDEDTGADASDEGNDLDEMDRKSAVVTRRPYGIGSPLPRRGRGRGEGAERHDADEGGADDTEIGPDSS